MAAQKTKSRGKSSKSSSSGRSRAKRNTDARPASQKTEKYRFAKNVEGLGTAAEREYRHYAEIDPWELDDELPDVLLDVPVVKVDSLHFELENLDAHLSLKAYVLDLVKLQVGVDVHLGKVRLDIRGVEAQALAKVRLDHVAAVVDRVMTTLDRNPELLESLGAAVEDIGAGGGELLGETGEAVEDVGAGARQAVGDIGQGAGQAVGDVGEGAGQAVGDIGQGAGKAVGDVGEGAGEAVGNLDETLQGIGQTVGESVGGLAEGTEQAAGGLLGIARQDGASVDELAEGAGDVGVSAGEIAKVATKLAAHELRTAASQEAKGLRVAAARKAKEIRERRRERQAEEVNATPRAVELAQELDVDLEEIDGTGADGRITVRDVRSAASG
jgi:hypothetical protein